MLLNRVLKAILLFVFLGAVSLPESQAALANSGRITRGDVEAVFNAFLTGGRTIRFHDNITVVEGAPADFFGSQGAIRPLSGSPWDGMHFCVDDWHVVVIGILDGGDMSYTRKVAVDSLSPLAISFALDHSPLPSTRTPIKRVLAPQGFGADEAYGFQEGRILSPEQLAVGTHSLTVDVHDPIFGDFQDGITFFVDPSNSIACSQ